MNTADSFLIYGTCGLIIVLPILGVVAVFAAHQIAKRNSRQQIPMEGATCTETLEGNVKIEGNRVRDILIIGFMGGTLAVVVLGFITAPDQDRLTSLFVVLIWSIFTVPVIWRLWTALQGARYYFSLTDRQLFIRQGRTQKALPFSELAGLNATITHTERQGLNVNDRNPVWVARLELTVKSGQPLLLGTLSSLKSETEILSRCQKIGGLVSQATGVTVTGMDPAAIVQRP